MRAVRLNHPPVLGTAFLLLAGSCWLTPNSARAWSPQTQIAISEGASSIAPHDLRRQLAKHKKEFRRGLLAPFEGTSANQHIKNPDGEGTLDEVLRIEVEQAIQAIQSQRSFAEIVFQLGVVAHFIADSNNPLSSAKSDPQEHTYFVDFLRYVESAQGRFGVVFYGEGRQIESPEEFGIFLQHSLERGRKLYPLIGREYHRIGRIDGVKEFDDRSTAFGVGALSFSHAVSDVAAVLRYIWLQAGGADGRQLPITPVAAAAVR